VVDQPWQGDIDPSEDKVSGNGCGSGCGSRWWWVTNTSAKTNAFTESLTIPTPGGMNSKKNVTHQTCAELYYRDRRKRKSVVYDSGW
jgi:hypothetical protein